MSELSSQLSGQTVAVVGASSGIGLATARAAAARGARVIMLSRSQARLDEAAASVAGGTTRAVAMDMLDAAAVDRVMASIGGIDHLVLTAVADELASRAPIGALTAEQVERSFDKLRGFVNVLRAAAPLLRERGSVTLMAGASAERPPREGFSVLAAASGSILSFGKALALELAPIRVNVLMAGVVDTAIHAGRREQMKAWAEKDLLVRRFGQPEDIAHAIEFLMTNPYMTGHTLTVDGGFVAI
ncbi:SDR family oxidoreductase [Sorangium sp. So ce1099]|uniref:SDR family oxidoreductase n=1 Tax=Sorangium sp. So ce1099 TaxID=3133331 RepID=UPI003F5FBC2D